MKKQMKKLLVMLLAAGLLTGCSSTPDVENPGDVTTEGQTDVTGTEQPVEITFWHAMNGEQEQSLQALTSAFMNANPNVKVVLQNQSSYNDLQQKITATLVSPKNLPTMTQAYVDWMFNPINDNLVADLEAINANFSGYDDILPSFREATKVDGKVYGIPFNKSTEVLWYNKTLFNELGLTVPTTYEELAAVSKEITEKTDLVGAGFDSLSNYYTTFLKNEGEVFDDSFDVTSEASVKAANYYLDGIKEGYFRIAGTDKFLSGPFGNETLAMYIGSNAGESFIKSSVADKFEIGVAPYPGNAAIQQGTDIYIFESATPEQKIAAFNFLEFMTDTQNQIVWGIETGYIPVRESAIVTEDYQTSGSLVAPVLEEVTTKLYTNPVLSGADRAYRESATVLEGILADPTNADVTKKLEEYKATLVTIWE